MSSFLFDIETQPLSEPEIIANMPPFDEEEALGRKGNRTKPDTIAQFIEDERKKHHEAIFEKAALNEWAARVLVVTYRWPDGTTEIDESPSEGHLIGKLWSHVYQAIRNNGDIIGFNIKSFDLPFTIWRSWLNQIPQPKALMTDFRWFNRSVIDLRDVGSLGRYEMKFRKGDLNHYSKLMGGPQKSEKSGKRFWEIYKEDRERALEYCQTEMDALEAIAAGMFLWKGPGQDDDKKDETAPAF